MLRNSYYRFFPTPYYLEEPSFGLDISDESLKFAELKTTKHGMRLGKFGERKIPPGIIDSGKIKDEKKLESILKDFRKEMGLRSVRVSLPEEQVYIFRLVLDKNGLNSIDEGIELSLEDHIPIPATEAVFDYEIIKETEKSLDLQVAVISINVAETYLSIFKNSSLDVQSFELEAQAIQRAVVKKGDKETYMIVDFGEKRTGIFIVSNGIVMFTSTLDFGGVNLTNMIMKAFNTDFPAAEDMKQKYGLQRNLENKDLFSVLLNGVSVLRDEISKNLLYWHTHTDENDEKNPHIKKIILTGGDANLIGLPDYFSVSMKTPVILANVWTNILDTTKITPDIDHHKSMSYATALGLALGDFYND